PGKERFELAMSLNNLLASPSFETWLTGAPLNVDQMLYSPSGKPRISIFSIAHLSDTERMFFVSLLLNQTLGWIRTRPGTTSLRAIVYMDEIFGYIPPVANPPSKKPLLTLLKQARAYGVGIVLATQNPVDLDYKGLSNIGTWLIGRLQTERDKQRVLDGLQGVSAGTKGGFDRKTMEETLAGLGKRVFLMHNIHETGPTAFHTRWAMSYLCGPLTRHQIKRVMEPIKTRRSATPAPETTPKATGIESRPSRERPSGTTPVRPSASAKTRPVLPPDIPQLFIPLREMIEDADLLYQPALLGLGNVHFVQRKHAIEHSRSYALLYPVDKHPAAIDWRDADQIDINEDDLERQPASSEAEFGLLPREAGNTRSYAGWKRSLSDMLYRTQRYELMRSQKFKMVSNPGESERDFRIRLADAARENRDYLVEKIRKKYASKFRTLEDRIRRAQLTVEREKEQAKHQKLQTAISLGATVLSAFLGRKKIGRSTLGRATTTARGMGRSRKEAQDIDRAKSNLETLKHRLEDLQIEFDAEIQKLEDRFDPELEELDTVTLKPRKKDIEVKLVSLAWVPYRRAESGSLTPARL
ncbi:MAG: ATP-binding protein, partial [Candidatus Latescibacterota bacterium]